ncbi:unnamed protein product [Mesocestoides corti]|uniref:Biogenesis of lysosome-related organelles complex 1 subunit 1 n=1 Tax=Mesocestoides corti TaxID=53468 RepID=A0A3P6GAS5_MESCO|nr:unnamed protein product [Mesocestoides corti]
MEVSKRRALDAITALTSQFAITLNYGVSEAYENQCRLNAEVKKLQRNIQNFVRQVDLWNKQISEISRAIKELGDIETWSQKLNVDMNCYRTVLQYSSYPKNPSPVRNYH